MLQLAPPVLHGWLANAAGILPLSAFISFIDSSADVHLYDLCGSLPLWAWTMTPAGARLLFATIADPAATFSGCLLDRAENTMPVHCIDGRWGDFYPSSSPYTVRLCVSACRSVAKMATTQARRALGSAPGVTEGRPLTLDVIRVKLVPTEGEALPQATSGNTGRRVPGWCNLKAFSWPRSLVRKCFAQQPPRLRLVSTLCWLAWAALTIISITTCHNIAVAYLFTIVATGVVIRFADAHHAGPRRLLNTRDETHPRLVVASNNMNAVRWTAFLGGHKLIDSLLNKPLYSASPSSILDRKRRASVRALLRLLIAAQWSIIVVACAMQDWNALLISAWIAISACCSPFYTPEHATREWLRINGLCLEKAEMTMSNRRVMLSALVALNPDQSSPDAKSSKWIDPILAPSNDRTHWEQELNHVLQQG